MSILILDNYDSFTYNLFHLVEKLTDERVEVIRNNKIGIIDIDEFDSIILSPGPGLPKDAGIMPKLLEEYEGKKKILGVCLGMQAIAEHFGGKLKNLGEVVHGEEKLMNVLSEEDLFKGLPQYFYVGRYHSWVVDRACSINCLDILAEDEQMEIMAIKHKNLPIYGVQFHPESILSQYGENIVKNWLSL